MLSNLLLNGKKQDNYIDSKQVLIQAYETTFGIFDHVSNAMSEDATNDPDKKKPFALVAFHEAEDFSSTSRLYDIIRIFKDRKVNSIFGLSLIEFLDLPADICDHILTLCNEEQKNEANITEQVNKELGIKK